MENRKTQFIRLGFGTVLFLISSFITNSYLSLVFLLSSYFILGLEVFKNTFSNLIHGKIFDENFLMTIATIGAILLKNYTEAVLVMMFFCVGETASDIAVDRSKDHISSLMDIKPEKAILWTDNETKEIKPKDIKIGDIIKVFAGEKVPIDGVLIDKNALLDTSALTGESTPVLTRKGNPILSGSIVLNFPILIKVTKSYENSIVTRILKLVKESQEAKAPTEKFMTRFAKVYTPVVCAIAMLIAVIPSLITGSWDIWIQRALNCLVISCPCALVLSIPLAFFAGIGGSARKGILLKGGNVMENLDDSKIVAFDKTGTLTVGDLKVSSFKNLTTVSNEKILSYCLSIESQSNHPIAKSIVKYCLENGAKLLSVANPLEENGKGISADIENIKYRIGSSNYLSDFGIVDSGFYLADENQVLACFTVQDSIKEDAAISIEKLKNLGIEKTVLISGDSEDKASEVSKILKIDSYFSRQLPEQKVKALTSLMKKGKCIYVGDGINDALCLLKADVGISMGKIGSASAVEASDAVIMTDELSKIPLAIKIAKKTMKIARQNITFALTVKLLCLMLGILGLTGMLVATLSDTGVALLCVFNSMRALSNK